MSIAHSLSPTKKEKVVPVKTFEGHKNWVECVAWYPDGRRLVSGSRDGELLIWDTETGSQMGKAIKGHADIVWGLDVSPDGATIASGSGDGTVRLWDSKTGRFIQAYEGHEGTIWNVHFSPDSKRLASGSEDRTMRIWDVETGELAFEPIHCQDWVYAVRYAPGGNRIVSGASTIQIWGVSKGGLHLVLTIEQGVTSLAWMHDGEHIVAGGHGLVTVWNALSGEQIRTLQTHTGWIQLSLSTTHLAVCSWNARQILVFDSNTGEQITEYTPRHYATVNYVAYSPSGKFIATASDDKGVYLWEAPQNSLSPGSSILDLPAAIRPVNAEERNQLTDQLPLSSAFDIPIILGPLPSVQPTNKTADLHRRTLRGAIDGIFRRRGGSQQHVNYPRDPDAHDQPSRTSGEFLSRSRSLFSFKFPRNPFTSASRRRDSSTDKREGDQEGRRAEGDWVAEARTRPFMTFRTYTLPDEVEHGCLFHFASYICYGGRDSNVRAPSHIVQASASGPASGGSPSTSGAATTHDSRPHTYPPAPAMANTPIASQASAAPLSVRIRARLGQLYTFLGSHQHSGVNHSLSSSTRGATVNGHTPAISGSSVPAVVITGPSPESADQNGRTAVAHQSASGQSSSPCVVVDVSMPPPLTPHISDPALRPSTTSSTISPVVVSVPSTGPAVQSNSTIVASQEPLLCSNVSSTSTPPPPISSPSAVDAPVADTSCVGVVNVSMMEVQNGLLAIWTRALR